MDVRKVLVDEDEIIAHKPKFPFSFMSLSCQEGECTRCTSGPERKTGQNHAPACQHKCHKKEG